MGCVLAFAVEVLFSPIAVIFLPENRRALSNTVKITGLKIFNMRPLRTGTIPINDELEMWMVLTQFAEKTSYTITFTIHFDLAVLFSYVFKRQKIPPLCLR